MATNPYKNKIVYNGNTLIDLTGDDVTAADVAEGVHFHLPSGEPSVGTASIGTIIVTDTEDSHGGIIKDIRYAEATYLQGAKSVTPTESAQTIEPDTGYDGFASVNVGAISSTYVGSGITRRSGRDLTASGQQVNVPAGYYENSAYGLVQPGSVSVESTTIEANPFIEVNSSTGVITSTVSAFHSVAPHVVAGYVSGGTTGVVTAAGSSTSQLTTQAAQTITPTTSDQTIASGTYLTGAQTIKGDANLVAGNIKKDISLFGVTGTYEPSNWKKIATQDFTLNTTETTNTKLGDVTLTLSEYNNHEILVWVHIRDKAGKRAGYFYGTDTIFFPYLLANNDTSYVGTRPVMAFTYTSNNAYSGALQAYGIYGYRLYYTSSNHFVRLYYRYSSTYTLTINGTYQCDVYTLTLPTGMTLFT